jgi:hypothetical protein
MSGRIFRGRFIATHEGDWALFVMGVRINRWWRPDRWLPVLLALRRMLRQLRADPGLGLSHAEVLWGNPVVTIQYWRSYGQLVGFATNPRGPHMDEWKRFTQKLGRDGAVAVFHELYRVGEEDHECLYNNMPPWGLGRMGRLEPVTFRNYGSAARTEAGKRLRTPSEQG